MLKQGDHQPGKPGILREFYLPQGKPGKLGIFLSVLENFLNGVLFELLLNRVFFWIGTVLFQTSLPS